MGVVYEPERQPDRGPTAGPGRRPAVLGAAALALAAIFVLGRFASPTTTTTPNDEHIAFLDLPTSTSTTLFQARGEPLEWARLVHLGNPPIAVVDVDGATFVYGVGPRGAGAELWSRDIWHLGLLVIDTDHYVQTIIETWFGLLAVGTEVATGATVVWTSDDGISWDRSYLPADGIAGMQVTLYEAHAADVLILISGRAWMGSDQATLYARAEEALRGVFGELLDWFHSYETESGVEFVVYGPLEIGLGSLEAEAIGLESSDYLDLDTPAFEVLWASNDGQVWDLSIDDHPRYLQGMFTGPDGGIWVYDHAIPQVGFVATSDGATWRRVPTTRAVYGASRWGSLVVGLTDQMNLVVSKDTTNWGALDLPDGLLGLPPRPGPFLVEGFASHESGLAVVAYRLTGDSTSPKPQHDLIIKRDGAIELWIRDWTIEVRRLGQVVTRIDRWDTPAESLTIDPHAGTLTFRDPVTGEALITVTADELRAKEMQRQLSYPGTSAAIERVMMFTRDGSEWIIQSIGMFDGRQIYGIHVFEDRLALVTDEGLGFSVMETLLP